MSWIQTDFDFGLPIKVFTVSIRELASYQIRDMAMNADPSAVEQGIMEIIRYYRPALAEGGKVVGLHMRGGFIWNIAFFHPSFPVIDCGQEWPVERLLTCPACGKGLPSLTRTCVVQDRLQTAEVCGDECAAKFKAPGFKNFTTLPASEWIGADPSYCKHGVQIKDFCGKCQGADEPCSTS